MSHVPELNRFPLCPFPCLRRKPPRRDENRLGGGVVMHHTKEVAELWFTHGSFACVALALNDGIDPMHGRDEIHTVVALATGPAHLVAKITETFGAPLLELFRR